MNAAMVDGVVAPDLLSAAEQSGWPLELLIDPHRQPEYTNDPARFLDFVKYGDHSSAQMCILRDGIKRLGLEAALPPSLLQAALRPAARAEECVLEAIEREAGGPADPLFADVYRWEAGSSVRQVLWARDQPCHLGLSLRACLRQVVQEGRSGDRVYVAELSRAWKTRHPLSGERSRQMTSRDVKDVVGGPLPMWDRGHIFVGEEGSGSVLHTDQAWWSNVGKNFLGQKLVALWGPQAAGRGPGSPAVAACRGQLFRAPLSDAQRLALEAASVLALLRPGDVVSFTGGLPHVIGSLLWLVAR